MQPVKWLGLSKEAIRRAIILSPWRQMTLVLEELCTTVLRAGNILPVRKWSWSG